MYGNKVVTKIENELLTTNQTIAPIDNSKVNINNIQAEILIVCTKLSFG